MASGYNGRLSAGITSDAQSDGRLLVPQGTRSDVSPEHLSMLLETKPGVSFHFGLPEIAQAIKSAGIVVLSSATTVAEARLLEERGVDAVIVALAPRGA